MSLPINSSYQLINEYQTAMFNLDSEKLFGLLASNVVIDLTINSDNVVIKGRDKVMAFYQQHFFEVTSNIVVEEMTIQTNREVPRFFCVATEDKTDRSEVYRVRVVDHSDITVIFEDDQPKIGKLVSEESKSETGLAVEVILNK